MINEDGTECWIISSDAYCAALFDTLEGVLAKKVLCLLSKCCTPFKHGYQPKLDATAELKHDGVQ